MGSTPLKNIRQNGNIPQGWKKRWLKTPPIAPNSLWIIFVKHWGHSFIQNLGIPIRVVTKLVHSVESFFLTQPVQWKDKRVTTLLISLNPSKFEWDLTNGPLSKLLELLDTHQVGVHSVGPVGDFLDSDLLNSEPMFVFISEMHFEKNKGASHAMWVFFVDQKKITRHGQFGPKNGRHGPQVLTLSSPEPRLWWEHHRGGSSHGKDVAPSFWRDPSFVKNLSWKEVPNHRGFSSTIPETWSWKKCLEKGWWDLENEKNDDSAIFRKGVTYPMRVGNHVLQRKPSTFWMDRQHNIIFFCVSPKAVIQLDGWPMSQKLLFTYTFGT